jgi:hypothetical protein
MQTVASEKKSPQMHQPKSVNSIDLRIFNPLQSPDP